MIKVRWVERLETRERLERYRGELKAELFDLGPVNVCTYQQDTEDVRFVPRYWKNRLKDQIKRRVHPKVLGGFSAVESEPLGEAKLKFLERRVVDVYALCYPGQFSPIPYRDPIHAIEDLADMCDDERRPERYCRICKRYDERPNSGSTFRPSGVLSRSACGGCLVSFVDKIERDPEEIQDDRIVEWLTARERLKDVEARKAHVRKPKERQRLKRERQAALERVKEAAKLCKIAGIDPKLEFRKRARKWVRKEKEA